jgi:hypothetical protein
MQHVEAPRSSYHDAHVDAREEVPHHTPVSSTCGPFAKLELPPQMHYFGSTSSGGNRTKNQVCVVQVPVAASPKCI